MVIYHKPFSYCNVGIQECFVINCDGCFLIGQSLKFMTNHKNFKVNHKKCQEIPCLSHLPRNTL